MRGIDEKALLEATLFGLPMLSVNLPAGRIYEAPDSSAIVTLTPVAGDPGSSLGLRFADTPVTSAGVTPKSLQLKNGDGSSAPWRRTSRAPMARHRADPSPSCRS